MNGIKIPKVDCLKNPTPSCRQLDDLYPPRNCRRLKWMPPYRVFCSSRIFQDFSTSFIEKCLIQLKLFFKLINFACKMMALKSLAKLK